MLRFRYWVMRRGRYRLMRELTDAGHAISWHAVDQWARGICRPSPGAAAALLSIAGGELGYEDIFGLDP